MLLSKLPIKVRDRIIAYSKEQGRSEDFYNRDDSTVDKSFTWARTPEGHEFWELVRYGKFDRYFLKYPEDKGPTEKEIKDEKDLYNFLNS